MPESTLMTLRTLLGIPDDSRDALLTTIVSAVQARLLLLLVLVAHRLDLALGASYVRDGVCIAFTVSEVISIAENAGLMGVPLPAVLERALEALKDKAKQDGR